MNDMSDSKDPYNSLIVNIFGGPGVVKSTTAAHLFAELKWRQVSVEHVNEYVKGKVYEKSFQALDHQIYIFGKQLHYIKRCASDVDVVVQDASLLNSLVYNQDKTSNTFKDLVIEEYNKFDNLNIFIERDWPYDPVGREQTESEAKKVDRDVKEMLEQLYLEYITFNSGPENIDSILDAVESKLLSS